MLDAILQGLVEEELPVAAIVGRGFEEALVRRVQHMLYIAEYKRRQAAPGVKITRRNFGRDRRYPITNRYRDPHRRTRPDEPTAGMHQSGNSRRLLHPKVWQSRHCKIDCC